MMQSIALYDSQQNESLDDFVLVQQPDQFSFDLMEVEEDIGADGEVDEDENDGDLESYDYCEDGYSIVSSEQCISLDSEELIDTHQFSTKNNEESEIILTVPSMLLKDLDAAHAAAKLVQIHDVEQRLESSSTSSFSVSSSSSPFGKDTAIERRMDMENPQDDVVTTTAKSNLDDQHHIKKDDIWEQQNDNSYNIENNSSGGGNLSRTSNKKRRKKLKLMKKAIAAANAAQALSERARSSCCSSRSIEHQRFPKFSNDNKKKNKTKAGVRHSRKRVANIAVTCATETLSAYRAEIAQKNQRK